jgi:integrase
MHKRLTDARIRSLRAKDNRYEQWDTEPGFGLRIAPTGRKTFIYLYRFGGRPRRYTIGVYPRTSLADARESVAKARVKIQKGVDPGAEKLAKRKAFRDADSFAELAHEWIERHAKPKRKTWEADKKLLETDALPAWGTRKAKSITRRDVIKLIDQVMDRGAPVAANRTLGLVKQVFKFGVQRDILDTSPAVAIDKPAREKRRDRVLSEAEIRTFWRGLDRASMGDNLRIALKLCLVTAQRRAEVTGLHRKEIDGDWWTIPKERSKNGKAHRVPLSPLAKQLISEASGDEYLFPSPRKEGPIEPRALINALAKNRDVLGDDRFTVHDLRRTASTRMAEISISRFEIGKVLNHTDHEVTAIYDLYAYDKEKKKALLAWDRRLSSILHGKASRKVVALS